MPEQSHRAALPSGPAPSPLSFPGGRGAEPSHAGAVLPALPAAAPRPGGAVPAPTSGLTGSDVALTENARLQPKKGQVRRDAALREPRWPGRRAAVDEKRLFLRDYGIQEI